MAQVGGALAVTERYGVCNGAVRPLDVADVTQAIRVDRRHIEIQHHAFGAGLAVAHPTLTLVAGQVRPGGNLGFGHSGNYRVLELLQPEAGHPLRDPQSVNLLFGLDGALLVE